jgi:hypothetical protein
MGAPTRSVNPTDVFSIFSSLALLHRWVDLRVERVGIPTRAKEAAPPVGADSPRAIIGSHEMCESSCEQGDTPVGGLGRARGQERRSNTMNIGERAHRSFERVTRR